MLTCRLRGGFVAILAVPLIVYDQGASLRIQLHAEEWEQSGNPILSSVLFQTEVVRPDLIPLVKH